MKIHLFEHRPDAHMRKAREYLEEAYLARIEHQVAAEHHGALARMYAERIAWLEEEISHALQPLARPPQARTEAPPQDDPRASAEPALYPVPSARATRPAA